MSTYEKKISNRKGNNKKRQAHQNKTAWKADKHSEKSREINSLPVYGLCQRCTDVILWRKQFGKYKPLTTPKKCTGCQEKAVKAAYHVLCNKCASERKVCAKCLESKEIVTSKEDIKTDADLLKEEQERERLLSLMSLRQRRSYLRKLERGQDVSHIKAEDFEDSDFDFGSDFDDEDNDVEDELCEKTENSLKT